MLVARLTTQHIATTSTFNIKPLRPARSKHCDRMSLMRIDSLPIHVHVNVEDVLLKGWYRLCGWWTDVGGGDSP